MSKSAIDWSHSASYYASPYIRIIGDARCFIGPLFPSGVQLALTDALSVAVSICATINGGFSERTAAKWYSQRILEAYTWSPVVVTSAYAQNTGKERRVLNEFDDAKFDHAFSFFPPSGCLSLVIYVVFSLPCDQRY
jgi:2-polyprenyl-6-methoxyphenol hydroxylase-like FAD-dependent oxidoreductase